MLKSEQPKRYPRNIQRVVGLVLPVWLVLAVELVGGWHYGKHPINLYGHYWRMVMTVLSVVIISPFLAITGLVLARRNRTAYRDRRRLYNAVLLFLSLSLLVSMFSCVWSCGGHPTWTSGYRN
jgi:hypothetical protein